MKALVLGGRAGSRPQLITHTSGGRPPVTPVPYGTARRHAVRAACRQRARQC